jgi:putative spermidine/putrescine transport system permease protein
VTRPEGPRRPPVVARRLYGLLLALVFGFIFLPTAVLAVVSLNTQQVMTFPPTGVSLRWWGLALSGKWTSTVAFSLRLAVTAALLAGAVGIPCAIGLARYRFRGRDLLSSLALSPLLLPEIVTGAAMLQFVHVAGLTGLIGFRALLLGHAVITAPYVVRTVLVSLRTVPPDVERAAANLGADPWKTFRHVTLPLARNGVFAGLVFAFILSFNNISISLFLVRPGATTVPMRLLQSMEFGMSPDIAAVAVLTVIINLMVIGLSERWAQVSRFLYERA